MNTELEDTGEEFEEIEETVSQEGDDFEDPSTEEEIRAASERGWKPKDKFKGYGGKEFQTARDFLEDTKKIDERRFGDVEERSKRLEATMEKLLGEARKAHEKEIKRYEMEVERLRRSADRAIEDGDADRARELLEQERKLERPSDPVEPPPAQPNPEFQDFTSRNRWYGVDEDATLMANRVAARIERRGGSQTEQIAAVEDVIRKRFPEHFSEPPSPDGGGRASPRSGKPRRTLPPEAKRQMEKDLKRPEFRDWTKERWQELYWGS